MAGPKKLKLDKVPDSWNRETLTSEQAREMAERSENTFNQTRSSNSGYQSPSRQKAVQQESATNKPFSWFNDPGHISDVVDSTTGQVISVDRPSRISGIFSGAAKSTGSEFLNAAGTAVNAIQNPDYNRRQIQRLEKTLETGWTTDGKKINDTQRATIQDAISRMQQEIQQWEAQNSTANRLYSTADRLQESAEQDIAQAKEGLGSVGQFAVDVGVAGTQLAGDVLVGALLAPVTGGVSAIAPMAVRSFGSGAQQARQEGASLGQQLAYGTGSAALGVATEKISNVAAPFRKIFGSGVADDLAGKLVSRFGENAAVQTMNRLAQTPVGKLAASMLGEGSEGFIEDVFQPVLQRATYDPDARFDLSGALYDAAVSAALGGVGGGVDIAQRRATASAETPQTETASTSTTQAQRPVQGVSEARTAQVQTTAPEADTAKIPAQNTPVNPDPLLQALTGGRRVDQTTLTNEQFASLADRGDVGMDAQGRVYQVDPAQHIDQRGADSISDRRVNAFQFDHPELQPYYQQAAQTLLEELNGAVRGGQTESATGEYGQTYSWRTRRKASSRISTLLDSGMSYARIESALDAIINDNGAENYADAKRVEAVLDDMLSNGYRGDDRFVSANEGYVRAKESIPGAVERVDDLAGLENGLGAADAGSLNTAYDRLQAQSSQFYPEGANAARPVDVPLQDFQGNPISKSASTVMGARAIPDDVLPQIEQMIADGRLSYQRNTDEASLNRATQRVQEKGFDGALEEFRTAVNQGRISKDITTLGQTLLNTAANNRDGNAVAEILSLYQTISTNTGQAMQAMSILRKLSPESQLYGIRRMVDNLNDKLIQKVNKEYSDIQIDPDLVNRFLEQTDQAGRNAVMQEIYQNVADQVPSTWQDKWNAWRYLAMLGNPRTHVRNFFGNVGFQPLRIIKNEVAAGIESALSAAGVELERSKSFAASPSLYKAAWRDYSNVAEILGGNKYDDVVSQVNQRRRIFSNRILELARRKNSDAMSFEDYIFKRFTYAGSLAGYLKANGVTAAQLESGDVDSALLQRARDYAGQEALRATYQDRNAISNRVDRLVRDAGVVGDAILPFRRTPANILARGLEYSPAGLVRGLWDAGRNVQNGNKTAAQAIDEIAAGLTGSALMGLGALAFASGAVTTAQGDDKDDEWAELLGHQGYAWEMSDGTSITLDWLAPESMPFFMGVELMSSMGESGMDANAVVDALKSIANPMLELSMLQSVNDLIDSVQYAEDAPLQAMIPSAIISYFTQAIPTLGGQIERSAEENRMSTYTDRNSSIPTDVQYALGRASSRIPGWDYQQTPYIDAWGRTESNGDPLVRALNNFLNPAYTSQVDIDAVEEELQRVRDATGDTAVFPSSAERYITVNGERKDLTAEEYQTYATTLGQTRYNLVSEGMELPEYRSMSDGEKAEYIGKLYDYASAQAKASVSNYALEGWQAYAETAQADLGISPAEYIAYYQKYGSSIMSGNGYERTKRAVSAGMTVDEYASAKENANTNGKSGVNKEEAIAYLDGSGYSRSQKADLWDIINTTGANNPYA